MAGPNISQNFYVSKNSACLEGKGSRQTVWGILVFRDPTNGYAIRVENIPLFDAERLTNSLWKTNNSGTAWEIVGDTPKLSAKLVLLPTASEMLLVTYNGKIFFTKNHGANWSAERTIP